MSAHSTAGSRCAHCGQAIEDRGEQTLDGGSEPLWVHIPGEYAWCRAGKFGSYRAEPAATVEGAQR